jgi:hypothetical protein
LWRLSDKNIDRIFLKGKGRSQSCFFFMDNVAPRKAKNTKVVHPRTCGTQFEGVAEERPAVWIVNRPQIRGQLQLGVLHIDVADKNTTISAYDGEKSTNFIVTPGVGRLLPSPPSHSIIWLLPASRR